MSDNAIDDRVLEETRAKLAAEAAAANAQAERDTALAAFHKAQTAKAEAEAEGARLAVEHGEIVLRSTRLEEAREMARDEHHHTYRFTGAVSASTVSGCIAKLTEWHRRDPECAITIVFNSPGGSVIDGMELWDFLAHLRTEGHHLTTVSRGYAASMAGILLQAGDHRVIGRESYLMIHEISAGAGGKIGEITDAVKFYERICDRVVGIFVNRSGGKCTKARFVKSWTRQDWWIDSDEAFKLGFVDEIA